MTKQHLGRGVCRAVALMAVFTATARAEFAFSFSLGAAFSQPTTVKVEDDQPGLPDRDIHEDTTFDTSVAVDFRFTYWFDPAPFVGVAFDFSYFHADHDIVEWNSVSPMSFLAMLRAPLARSRRFPTGQVQPYLGVGPSIVFATTEIDLEPDAPVEVDGYSADIGLDVRAGLEVLITPQLGIFAEYRLLYWVQHLHDDSDWWGSSEGGGDDEAKLEMLTHFAMLGVSFHF